MQQTEYWMSSEGDMTAYNMYPNGFVQAFGKYSNKQATVISRQTLIQSRSDTFKKGPVSDAVKCLKHIWKL